MNRQSRRATRSHQQRRPALVTAGAGNRTAAPASRKTAVQYNDAGNAFALSNKLGDALVCYEKAIDLEPGHAELHNNRGNILQLLKQYDQALVSYDTAITLKPDQALIHNNRGNVLQGLKRYADALGAYDTAIRISPDLPTTRYNRGLCLDALRRFDDALASYDTAIALKPDYAEAYINRGLTLHALLRFDDALTSFDSAITIDPASHEAYNNRGLTLQAMDRFDEALASYDAAIAIRPDFAEALHNRGVTLICKGDMPAAEVCLMRALAANPDCPKVMYSLTYIRKYGSGGHADIGTMQNKLRDPNVSLEDKEFLYFSLGKVYDDCGRYDDAFDCYRRGNELRNASLDYDSDKMSELTTSIIDVFSKDLLAQSLECASDDTTPLFIVGMPRSGTTLLASILSNHPQVETAGELRCIIDFTEFLPVLIKGAGKYPQAVINLTGPVAAYLIDTYGTRLRRDIRSNCMFIVDKHPLNFMHLGFISMLFPKAQIVHCMRHPLDTGLSNYFQRFASYYDYAFDLGNIGRFHRDYARLMDHWRAVLPVAMLEVQYESVIADTEQIVRRMLERLHLDWDDRCLVPHTNPAAVVTASNWQVRQPIYNHAIDRWRHYEKHLGPLKEAIGFTG